uniref:PHD-type domain-containing protein n=1 Tax=Cucumis sativus TaxID=3659 RepID=A0A0A0KMK1_CUCSA
MTEEDAKEQLKGTELQARKTQVTQLPCDGDGICMLCKAKPSDVETITCKTCVTPWHVSCLSSPPETLASTLQWDCPDCSTPPEDVILPPPGNHSFPTAPSSDLVTSIRAIEADVSLTDREKANKRQELLSGKLQSDKDDHDTNKEKIKKGDNVFDLIDERLNCSFCMQLPERPVTPFLQFHFNSSSVQ